MENTCFYNGISCGRQAPKPLSHHLLLPGPISRELSRKQSWAFTQAFWDGMWAPQVAGSKDMSEYGFESCVWALPTMHLAFEEPQTSESLWRDSMVTQCLECPLWCPEESYPYKRALMPGISWAGALPFCNQETCAIGEMPLQLAG